MASSTAEPKGSEGFTQSEGLPAVPIVLGMVGHLNLTGDAAIRARLRNELSALFKQFRKAYPHTPLVLLSSLAEGADQFVADVALANGVFVRAPLPFEQDVFRDSTSFTSDDGRKKLDGLLGNPEVESFRVPLPMKIEQSITDWRSVASGKYAADPTLVDVCYANVGGYIVRHCHVLIALWDGDVNRSSPSVTGQMVAFKRQGIVPEHYPWTKEHPLGFRGECGPVYVISAPRTGSPEAEAKVADAPRIHVPAHLAEESGETPAHAQHFERLPAHIPLVGPTPLFQQKGGSTAMAELRQFQIMCQNVDDLNSNIRSLDLADLRARMPHFPPDAPADLPTWHLQWLERLTLIGVAADRLAGKLDTVVKWTQCFVFASLFAGIGAFHLYVHGEPHQHEPWHLVLFLGSLIFAALILGGLNWYRVFEERLDYRALAEALRVRRAWAVAGIDASVADSYLGQLRGEVSWVRRALQHVCPPPSLWSDAFQAMAAAEKQTRVKSVRDGWVVGQIVYYEKAHKRKHRMAVALRFLGRVLIFLAWVWIPLMLLWDTRAELCTGFAAWWPKLVHRAVDAEHLWIFTSGLLAIAGGLLLALRERRAYEELANQYERMVLVFNHGAAEIDLALQAGEIERAQGVFLALGREAIAEHAQWSILRRARPLEIPAGG